MIRRLLLALRSLWFIVDIAIQWTLKTPVWVLLGRARPSSRCTCSATLGYGAAHGIRWCVIGAGLVDRIFGAGHCARAHQREAADVFPL